MVTQADRRRLVFGNKVILLVAMANGFTGIMGYASTLVSGIGIAFIKEHFGWGVTLGSIAGFALIGMILFLFAWNSSANGYRRS